MMTDNTALRAHQMIALDALRQVDRLFKENGIEYFLLAGSLLGAVRHNGFIPWDDDIDIGIFYRDREKAYRLIKEMVEPPLEWIEYINPQKRYPRSYGKIVHNRRTCIDVFLLVKTSDNCIKRRMQWVRRKVLFKMYKEKIRAGYQNRNGNPMKEYLKKAVARLLSGTMSAGRLMQEMKANESRYEHLTGQRYYVNFYSTYSLQRELIESDWLLPAGEVTFEGDVFPTVNVPDAYLRHLYGDYMKLPDEKHRAPKHA